MRIVQLVTTLRVGGGQRMVANLARHLRRSGHAVHVVAMYPAAGSSIEADLAADGVPVSHLGKRPGIDPRMIARIGRAVSALRPDVLHTHLGVLKYAVSAPAAWRCPVVHTVHNLAEREAERASRLLHYLAFRAHVTPVAIGEAVAASVRRVYRLADCPVIPNGVAVLDYAPPPGARARIRAGLSIGAGAPAFVAVGRMDTQKDHATLLRAFASERLRAAGAHLLLAGEGALRDELERLARSLPIAGRVHFLGVRSDVAAVLAAADAFVLSSRWEGNPLAVMEAMAAGKPVVATSVGCVPELVPASAGTLVPPGDAGALEAAMVELARDPARARARGAAAARLARDRFDVSVMVRSYEALYAALAAARSTSREERAAQ